MKINVAITTYNRPHLLNKLLEDIDREAKGYVEVVIYNDGSTEKYPIPVSQNITIIHQFIQPNHGRKGYYALVNMVFNDARESEWDYFFMLPDDVRLCDGFFNECLTIYELTNDAICLSVGHTHDRIERPNWTGFEPEETVITHKLGRLKEPEILTGYVQTQWNDLCFMCEREFFNVLPQIKVNPNRWKRDPNLGSGVGQFISTYLHNQGYSMYHTKESLVIFQGAIDGEPSQMFR